MQVDVEHLESCEICCASKTIDQQALRSVVVTQTGSLWGSWGVAVMKTSLDELFEEAEMDPDDLDLEADTVDGAG